MDRLLNRCLEQKIDLADIRILGDLEMTLRVTAADYERLAGLCGSKYRITVLADKGYKPAARRILSNKVGLLGLALFLFLIYYQSQFVSEIRITGYEAFTEAQVRESLEKFGFVEGCRKDVDIQGIEVAVSEDLGNITWMNIVYTGCLAEVQIVEGTPAPVPVDKSKPCHIVADREGYVQEVIPLNGVRAVQDGTYVRPGDVLVSGMVPLSSTAYGTESANVTERYVHAEGIVTAKVPYRFVYYQDGYELVKEKTGRRLFGLEVTIGGRTVNTAKWMNRYETAQCSDRTLVRTLRPFPIKIAFLTIEEVTLEKRQRSEEEVRRLAEAQLRAAIKEKLPENAEIINKSLNFTAEKNIIEISAMIESLQEIGTEQEIIFGTTESTE